MRKHSKTLFCVLFIIVGLILVCYPFISNLFATHNQSKVIQKYQDNVSQVNDADKDVLIQKARAYNESLTSLSAITDPFEPLSNEKKNKEYEEALNVDENGMIGYIEIEKIQVYLPIFHGTSEDVLQRGVGHLQNSSLPLGENDSHVILSGHRGLASQKMFTDLNLLNVNDTFLIHVLDKTFCYQIDQIKTVLPNDTNDLRIEEGKDLVTLITCTPYGINTHRLLIRGHQIDYTENNSVNEGHSISLGINTYYIGAIVIALIILFIFLFVSKSVAHG